MLLGCLSIIVISVAAIVMWWQRRPKASLGAPGHQPGFRIPGFVVIVAVAFGLLFPLVGLSMLVMLAVDCAMPERWRKRL